MAVSPCSGWRDIDGMSLVMLRQHKVVISLEFLWSDLILSFYFEDRGEYSEMVRTVPKSFLNIEHI